MELVVSIIGFGNIGKAIGTLLLPFKEFNLIINIIDKDEQVYGAILDLKHSLELHDRHEISFNNAELLNQSDFIFHCAGASVPKGESRLYTCQSSAEITESIFKNFKPEKTPYVIVVANPVDIITHITQKVTQLPKNHVIGTGTFLDSIRMNYIIKEASKNVSKVKAVVLGEHGSTAFLSEELSRVNEAPISTHFKPNEMHSFLEKMKSSASEIRKTQEATIYGVSFCAIRIFELLNSKEGGKIPISTFIPDHLKNNLGDPEIYLSLNSHVSSNGIFPDESYRPTTQEINHLKKSIQQLKDCIPNIYL